MERPISSTRLITYSICWLLYIFFAIMFLLPFMLILWIGGILKHEMTINEWRKKYNLYQMGGYKVGKIVENISDGMSREEAIKKSLG